MKSPGGHPVVAELDGGGVAREACSLGVFVNQRKGLESKSSHRLFQYLSLSASLHRIYQVAARRTLQTINVYPLIYLGFQYSAFCGEALCIKKSPSPSCWQTPLLTMLSFTELLNPEPSLPEIPSPFRPRSAVSSPSTSTIIELSSKMDRSIVPKGRTAKGSSNMTKSKLRGHVVHYPFENLDQVALRQVEHFQVDPFGSIFESCQHIPYNSGKKDFFEKTGRESFEGNRSITSCFRQLLISSSQCFAMFSNTQDMIPSTL